MRTEKDVAFYDGENKADVYLPDGRDFDTIVYFHGGGMIEGSKNGKNIVDIAQYFCKNGYMVVCSDYTLYPKAKYPQYIEECAKAVAFAQETALKQGGSGKIIVAGQSAGAWLAMMLCLDKRWLSGVKADYDAITAWLIDSAQMTSHYNVMKFEKGLSPMLQRIDKFAPLYYIDEKTSHTSMLMIYYENDMPCRAQQNQLAYAALKNANNALNVEIVCLKGGHCAGSAVPNEKGEYEFATVALKFLEKLRNG